MKNDISNFRNQNRFMFSVDNNDIFDHMNLTNPGNKLSILNTILKFQYLTKFLLKFKEAL